MKLIDLLNMAANGEALPEIVKVEGTRYKLIDGDEYFSVDPDGCFLSDYDMFSQKNLNLEVEVLEDV